MSNAINDNSFFYFISEGKFLICDLELCGKSEHSFDMRLFDLANNVKVLNCIHLLHCAFRTRCNTYNEVGRSFCDYLYSFYAGQEKNNRRHEKMITNPVVRISIYCTKMLQRMKEIFPNNQIIQQ